MRCVGEVGTVDAAAVGDDERGKFAQGEIERRLFPFKRGGITEGSRVARDRGVRH